MSRPQAKRMQPCPGRVPAPPKSLLKLSVKQSASFWNSFTAPLSILESWDGISWFLNWYHFAVIEWKEALPRFGTYSFFFSLNDYRPKHWNDCNSLLHVEVQLIRFQKWGGLQCKGAIWLWLQTPLGQRQNLGTTCRECVTGLSMPHGSEMPYSEHFSSSVALSSRSLPHLKTPDTSHPPRFPLPSRSFPDSHQPHFGFRSIWIVTQPQSDW